MRGLDGAPSSGFSINPMSGVIPCGMDGILADTKIRAGVVSARPGEKLLKGTPSWLRRDVTTVIPAAGRLRKLAARAASAR